MLFSLLAVLTLTAVPSPASTPVVMPGDDQAQRFKELFEQGEALYGQGEYGMAIHFFRLADARRVTPEVAYDLAKCSEKLNESAFVVYYYRLYMKRAPTAPDTLTVAEKVGKLLSKLETQGQGFLELDVPRGRAIAVSGKRFPEGPVAMFLPKGEYDLSADFPAGRKSMKVQVQAGRAVTVSFEPLRPPLLAMEMALPAEAVAKGIQSAVTPGPSAMRLSSFGLMGLGVAALVGGAVLGALSAQEATDLKTNKALSITQARTLAQDANGKATVANVLFGVGAAAGLSGGLLFVFSMPEPGGKPPPGMSR